MVKRIIIKEDCVEIISLRDSTIVELESREVTNHEFPDNVFVDINGEYINIDRLTALYRAAVQAFAGAQAEEETAPCPNCGSTELNYSLQCNNCKWQSLQ